MSEEAVSIGDVTRSLSDIQDHLLRMAEPKSTPARIDYKQLAGIKEYRSTTPVLSPFQEVKFEYPDEIDQFSGRKKPKDSDALNSIYNENLKSDFAYFSKTFDLEIEGERVRHLQNIVDRMLVGTDKKARVVIMRKGRGPNAFVTADGTIFISQSLLNVVDTKDEIGSVLAHELNHLLHRTAEMMARTHTPGKMAIGWLHEMAGDMQTTELMEKANLNTRAFESAIQKIAKNSRSIVHQAALARAVEVAAKHTKIDTRTSSLPQTALDSSLKSAEPHFSNDEIIQILKNPVEDGEVDAVAALIRLLPLLHGRDLESITFSDEQGKVAVALIVEMQRRMKDLKISDIDSKLFLLAVRTNTISAYTSDKWEKLYRDKDLGLWTNATEFEQLAAAMDSYHEQGTMVRIHRELFETVKNPRLTHPDIYTQMMDYVNEIYLPRSTYQEFEKGLSMNAETVLPYLANIFVHIDKTHHFKYAEEFGVENEHYEDIGEHGTRNVRDTLIAIARQAHLDDIKDTIDTTAVRSYFERARSMGINWPRYAWYQVTNRYQYCAPGSIEAQYYEIIADVFKIKLKEEKERELTFEELTQREIREGFCNPDSDKYMVAEVLGEYFKRFDWEKEKIPEWKALHQEIATLVRTSIDETTDSPCAVLKGGWEKENLEARFGHPEDAKILQFTLQVALAKGFFQVSDQEYYDYITNLMNTSEIDIDTLTLEQLANLCSPFLFKGSEHFSKSNLYSDLLECAVEVDSRGPRDNYDALVHLPFVATLLKKVESIQLPDSLDAVIARIEELQHHMREVGRSREPEELLYSSSLFSVLMGGPFRKKIIEILSKEPGSLSHEELQAYTHTVFGGMLPPTRRFKGRLHKQYLDSPQYDFETKTDYLLDNIEEIGYEGIVELAKEITEPKTYELFRAKLGKNIQGYMEKPTTAVGGAMAIDYGFSLWGQDANVVFESAQSNPAAVRDLSTRAAQRWAAHVIGKYNPQDRSDGFDPALNKYIVYKPDHYSTFHDIVDGIHDMGMQNRFFTALKLLTENRGALHSAESRQEFGHALQKAIGLSPGFMADAIQSVVEAGDPKLVGLLGTQIMSPLLFRAVDSDKADYQAVYDQTPRLQGIFNDVSQLEHISNSPTEAVIYFGAQYRNEPDSVIAKKAQESMQDFQAIHKLLERHLPEEKNKQEESAHSDLDPAVESVIKGVERSSPMGVRSLQLARQLYHFSPAVERRLSDAIDANPGLEKLFIWENLYRWAQHDAELRKFMDERLVTIDEYLGGGSLFTTYAATLREADGTVGEYVIKILNPSAVSIIDENYDTVQQSIAHLKHEHGRTYKHEIATVETLIDFSHSWCLADINDPHFMEDDAQFRTIIDSYSDPERFKWMAPTVAFNSQRVKVEKRVRGKTSNALFKQAEISQEEKTRIVRSQARFLLHQLESPPVIDAKGERYQLLRSDPSLGNYVVDQSAEVQTMGVIDRSMYLRLAPEDVTVMKSLIYEQDKKKFLNGLIDRILDINKVRNKVQRGVIKGKVWMAVGKEVIAQIGADTRSNFQILQQALSHLPEGIVPPLEHLLMIRNIAATEELLRQQGLTWDSLSAQPSMP